MAVLRQVATRLTLGSLLVFAVAPGCKKKDDATVTPPEPPTLEFLGAENELGDEFAPEDDLVLGCNGYLTLHLGPVGSLEGTIENWQLQPPASCGGADQCGYLRLEARNAAGRALVTVEQALASPLLDLGTINIDNVADFHAVLVADDGTVFAEEEVPVEATWAPSLSLSDTCDGEAMGGSGGAEPAPPMGGDSAGGAGGLGGSTGE